LTRRCFFFGITRCFTFGRTSQANGYVRAVQEVSYQFLVMKRTLISFLLLPTIRGHRVRPFAVSTSVCRSLSPQEACLRDMRDRSFDSDLERVSRDGVWMTCGNGRLAPVGAPLCVWEQVDPGAPSCSGVLPSGVLPSGEETLPPSPDTVAPLGLLAVVRASPPPTSRRLHLVRPF
jgi:hypothetical protein